MDAVRLRDAPRAMSSVEWAIVLYGLIFVGFLIAKRWTDE